jgi:hypothetical protein
MELMLSDAQKARSVINDLYDQLNGKQQKLFDHVMRQIWQKEKMKQHQP